MRVYVHSMLVAAGAGVPIVHGKENGQRHWPFVSL
eukprot:COSAG04_NODE_9094_length_899_cov_1.125000_1_plen_34_part_10